MSVLGDTRQRASIRCARSLQTAGRSDAGHHRARPLRQAGGAISAVSVAATQPS